MLTVKTKVPLVVPAKKDTLAMVFTADINECDQTDSCDANANANLGVGACVCNAGFTGDGIVVVRMSVQMVHMIVTKKVYAKTALVRFPARVKLDSRVMEKLVWILTSKLNRQCDYYATCTNSYGSYHCS